MFTYASTSLITLNDQRNVTGIPLILKPCWLV